MDKVIQVFKVYGILGVAYLILYKFFFIKHQPFKNSLEILEWALKNGIRLEKNRKSVAIYGLPGFLSKVFYFRPFSSDSMVVKQHFFSQELAPIVAYFRQKDLTPRLMIDAGGNIGVTACYMHWHFPGMRSLFLEPSNSNIKVAKENLKQENSLIWEKALWHRSELLKFDERRGAWAMRISGSTSGKEVEAVSLSEILSDPEFQNPDYIKTDIEGAEEEVFEKDEKLGKLIQSVSCISVEPHSEKGSLLINKKLSSWGFRVEYHGELIIGFR